MVEHYPERLTEEEQQQLLGWSTRLMESYMRRNLYYHTPHEHTVEEDGLIVGYYFEDIIYACLYYNYGVPGQPGNREAHSKKIEEIFARLSRHTVLVHVQAAPEAIVRRLTENTHSYRSGRRC